MTGRKKGGVTRGMLEASSKKPSIKIPTKREQHTESIMSTGVITSLVNKKDYQTDENYNSLFDKNSEDLSQDEIDDPNNNESISQIMVYQANEAKFKKIGR